MNDTLAQEFQENFAVVAADTPELAEAVYRLRYRVYAEELRWEDRDRFPTGRETDAYDSASHYCLLKHRPSDAYIGCVRLIQVHPATPFPFEIATSLDARALAADFGEQWRACAGEISRVAVIADFRRRGAERHGPVTDIGEDPGNPEPGRRIFPHIAVGLYLGAAATALLHGMERVFALMEPKLARRLRTYGIQFEAIGDAVEHHGLRVPYRLEAATFAANLAPRIAGLMEVIIEDLRRSG